MEKTELTITDVTKQGRDVYDGEKLFRVYHEWGRAAGYSRLEKWANEHGMYHPGRGKASKMGAYFAMWRWALRNPQKAWEIFEPWAREYENELTAAGVEINYQEFMKVIERHLRAKGSIGFDKYLEFCREHGIKPNRTE